MVELEEEEEEKLAEEKQEDLKKDEELEKVRTRKKGREEIVGKGGVLTLLPSLLLIILNIYLY